MLTARGISLGIGLLQTLNTVLCKCVLRLGYSLHTTRLSLHTSFDQQAAGAVLDMEGDEGTEMKRAKSLRKWYVGYVTILLLEYDWEGMGWKFMIRRRLEGR